jgi:hypothetical protein
MSKANVISDGVRMHVGRRLWAMIELQGLTGIRPGEVVILRGCDLSTQEKTWEYVPAWHQTEHHERHSEPSASAASPVRSFEPDHNCPAISRTDSTG